MELLHCNITLINFQNFAYFTKEDEMRKVKMVVLEALNLTRAGLMVCWVKWKWLKEKLVARTKLFLNILTMPRNSFCWTSNNFLIWR